MNKRSNIANDIVGDTHSHLAEELASAAALVDKLREPAVPDTSNLSELGEEQLEDLQKQVEQSRAASVNALEAWESYQQHVKHSVEAALLLVSLRGGSKRRRTAAVFGSEDIEVGSMVAFRLPSLQEEWIVCEVLGLSDGIYELRDPEPDDGKSKIYNGKAKDVIAIPSEGDQLSQLSAGTNVLAQYPETTAFYKAEVVSQRGDKVRLVFEGEKGKVTEVMRWLVLPR